jgi:hypothetical protein
VGKETLALLAFLAALTLPASAEWKEQVLYSFQGGSSDGSVPAGGVVFDKKGNLYGATTDGGPASCAPIGGACGTVFQLTPPTQKGGSWTETLIYQFQGEAQKDGSVPTGGLIFDAAGNLYGVTGYGGTGDCVLIGVKGGCGTVYELSPPTQQGGAWTETILYSFQGGNDGYVPSGDLVFDKSGNLYGSTIFGGGKGTTCDSFYQYCGTVFKLSPLKKQSGAWTEKVLHSFAGVASGQSSGDGANPNGGLVLDSKGAVYGTTYYGGNNQKGTCEGGSWGTGCGIVFRLIPPTKKGGAWTEKVLHSFDGKDGSNSAAGVIFDGNGNLYGTTYGGPMHGYGLVFELKGPSGKGHSWRETVLHPFGDGNDGGYPSAGLTFDSIGNLYGTAFGGETHAGVVFRLKPPEPRNSWPLTVLYNFSGAPDGDHPTAALIFDRKGNLYSTTQWGGTGQSCQGGCGTVFEVTP